MIPYQFNMKIGPTPGKTIQLTKPELSIGRDLSNDIVISDADVSRKHARLVAAGRELPVGRPGLNQWYFCQRNSADGTSDLTIR